MSTSFMIERELVRWVEKPGLTIELISADPYAHDAEYRIYPNVNGQRPEARHMMFQGTSDRCSDFVKGYLLGGAAKP